MHTINIHASQLLEAFMTRLWIEDGYTFNFSFVLHVQNPVHVTLARVGYSALILPSFPVA